ncbi:group III truncated hemoglobin [Nocardia sp. NBC_00511]|uniref:group III truncated hemoglobin n=1 Tax=Nocardia sp. NBC_00511 TaxID=2903591 RepID=UPI0030E342FC
MTISSNKPDITGRDDLEALLRRFYVAAFTDSLIGPYFTEIARTDLEIHIPRITDFWERALFRTAEYRRNAFAPHAKLHAAIPMRADHFGRWVQLWRAAVDGRYAGPNAERAKAVGERIAISMFRRLNGPEATTTGDGPGFVALAAVGLRVA